MKHFRPRLSRRAFWVLCALLVCPPDTFHAHSDGADHQDCPICQKAVVPADLTAPPLPVVTLS